MISNPGTRFPRAVREPPQRLATLFPVPAVPINTSLPERDKQDLISKTADIFLKNGADFTIKTMEELPELIDHINLLISDGKRPRSN
ncbi:hypothetical protein H7T43_19430 [Peribacillus simplex]|nr:hypothetical protein [Peribacillus simplex]